MAMQNVLVFLAATALGFVAAYFSLKRSVRRHLDPSAVLEEIRSEVDGLIVELNETTERNVAILEDRIAELTRAVERADRRIGVLRKEAERREESLEAYRALGAQMAPPRADGQEAREAVVASVGDAQRQVREQVMRLHRSGVSVAAIARKVDMPPGEVELVISLGEHGAER